MNRWKLLLFAPILCASPLLAACGDDEGNNAGPPDTGVTDGPPTTDGPEIPDAGKDSADGSIDLSSFPKYVKSLIELKTDDKGIPEPESVWGTIADDDKFVFPTTFFP